MLKSGALAVLVGGLMSVGSVASAAVVNGYEWDNVYTGDQLPLATDAKWNVFANAGASAVHNGDGTITLTSPPAGSPSNSEGIYYTQTGDWNPAATAYAEFKLKTTVHDGEVFGTTLSVMSENAGGLVVLLSADGLHLNDDPNVLVHALDTSVFHVYRVSIAGATYSISIDGAPVVVNKALDAGLVFDILRIGDPGTNIGGAATYEYVAFNNESAPVAVPEPTAGLVVASMAGLALGRRRRSVA